MPKNPGLSPVPLKGLYPCTPVPASVAPGLGRRGPGLRPVPGLWRRLLGAGLAGLQFVRGRQRADLPVLCRGEAGWDDGEEAIRIGRGVGRSNCGPTFLGCFWT